MKSMWKTLGRWLGCCKGVKACYTPEQRREILEKTELAGRDAEDSDEMAPEYDFSDGVRGKHHEAYQIGVTVEKDGSAGG